MGSLVMDFRMIPLKKEEAIGVPCGDQGSAAAFATAEPLARRDLRDGTDTMASSSAVQTPRDATCDELANRRCVFIVALGRTGSSHLLNLLNAIDGYRISGETDNSWLYLGWFASAARGGGFNASGALACEMRRLMLAVHNPAPRARVNLS